MVSGLRRGDVCMQDLGTVVGSRPAKRRPVVVIQSNRLNGSLIETVVVATVTSQTKLSTYPGNVFVGKEASGLPLNSVVNVTSLSTLNKDEMSEPIGRVPDYLMVEVDAGIRLILDL